MVPFPRALAYASPYLSPWTTPQSAHAAKVYHILIHRAERNTSHTTHGIYIYLLETGDYICHEVHLSLSPFHLIQGIPGTPHKFRCCYDSMVIGVPLSLSL